MVVESYPVLGGVLASQRRSLTLWSIALAGVSALYIGIYPSMGANGEMAALVESLPEAMVTAFGYDQIGTPGGWLTSTVYGLIGPVLLLVFGIANGSRLIAGQEEDGTLELELASPVGRRHVFGQRLAALWIDLLVLVGVVTVVAYLLVVALDMEVGLTQILAGSSGLLLLVGGFSTVALTVGAITGRRTIALGTAAGLATVAFIFDAIGPTIEAGWMTAASPFSWYLGESPLIDGFDIGGLARLAAIPVAAAIAGFLAFDRRDLMV